MHITIALKLHLVSYFVWCLRDYLADYSSALTSLHQSNEENSSRPSASGAVVAVKSSVSSVRVLFEVLGESLKGDEEVEDGSIQSGIRNSLPFLLCNFLEENR